MTNMIIHKRLLIRRMFSPKKFKHRTGQYLDGKLGMFNNVPGLNSRLLTIASQEYGIKEISGHENNPRIMQYFKELGMSWAKNDETSWCSIFINFVCSKAGAEKTMLPTARSWLEVGELINSPEIGDLAIFWRESPMSWKGHVGFYINNVNEKINVLGGNQNNSVCIKSYRISKLLGYRRLRYVDKA